MTTSEGDPDMIWNQDQFIHLIKTNDEFAKEWGELGPIYGAQWRNWNTKQFESLNDGNFGYRYNDVRIDQIQNLINDLKTNPDSRRLMVSAWNVGELDQMVLPPCHYGFQVYTRELKKLERINIAIERKLTHETAHLIKDFEVRRKKILIGPVKSGLQKEVLLFTYFI